MSSRIPKSVQDNAHIILFDGVCKLCTSLADFLDRRDRDGLFRYVWAQDRAGREIMQWCGLDPDCVETMVYIEKGRVSLRSTGLIRIARHLRFPWNLLCGAVVIPESIRDRIYNRISADRYRWFGKTESCPLPPPSLRRKFVES